MYLCPKFLNFGVIFFSNTKLLIFGNFYFIIGKSLNSFTDKNHNFVSETKFSDVVALYYLDVDLRNILMRYINRIEINFRTKLIYYVSNKYKSFPAWFADSAVISQNFISNINKFYNQDFIRNNAPIKRHHAKYPKYIRSRLEDIRVFLFWNDIKDL